MLPRQFNPRSLSAAVLGASLALVGFNASADAGYRVRSETSAVAITVIDLTPNDGRAAGFTKEVAQNRLYTQFTNNSHVVGSDYNGGAAPSGSVSIESGTSYAKRSYGPDIGQFASDTAISIGKHGALATSSNGDSGQGFSLTILPFTEVHLTGTYMLSIERTGSDMAYSTAYVGAAMSLNQWSFDSNGVPTHTFNDEYRVSKQVTDSSGNESESGHFDLVYTNDRPWAETIRYDAFISESVSMGQISHEIPPVPEPVTYAMLGMGLLVLGATARRRQRRAALHAQGGREPG
ncbi:PEP-CTERM sorting domain-containing protein [Massilia sp. P8910]|uniref:PEP-CTERM sorting domain-containing protein n=1 Tax=Massilia antarctica TaxID=2765360 RepID=UPI001E53E9DA|nr:PEP-CTERM sorting domain-containing protein [Massilia antarctica]MCE3604519.1 PEP-CTERM sorting domain-containing protein [Massilia antarctica]